jgi:type VI secretion system protein ImpK
MNDAFEQLVGPVFQYVIDFPQRLAQGENPPLQEVRGELLTLLSEAEQRASSREQASDFALAKYALVYWTDEILINSTWSHALEWRDHILEWEYFRERLAGEEFFEKARQAEGLTRTDALEVYFLCVALGFQGKYAINPAELQRWAGRVYERVASASQPSDRFLPEDPGEAQLGPLRPLPGKSVLLGVSILVSVTALVTLACFLLAVHLTS